MPLLEQLGEAQHRIGAWNACAMPTPGRSWHPLCHQAKQFSLGNSDDVTLPDQARRSDVSPGVLARLMLCEIRPRAVSLLSDLPTR